jgi:hypothetical protein
MKTSGLAWLATTPPTNSCHSLFGDRLAGRTQASEA